jgi:hypothetical protein
MMSIEKTQQLKRLEIPIESLQANPMNPNSMTDAEFNMLYDNMETVGFVDPAFVRANPDGTYRIIGGHHRVEVARLLGYEKVPCTIIDDPEFTEDEEKFQMVRMNVIHGKMSPQKFADLYNSLSGKYAEQVLADSFGFASEEEFQKLIAGIKKGLPKTMQKEFVEAAKEIKTIDGLTTLLNHMFTTYGDTLPHGFMILDFGGKDSVWVRLDAKTKKHLDALGQLVVLNDRTMDDVLGNILAQMAEGSLAEQVQEAITNSTPLSAKG